MRRVVVGLLAVVLALGGVLLAAPEALMLGACTRPGPPLQPASAASKPTPSAPVVGTATVQRRKKFAWFKRDITQKLLVRPRVASIEGSAKRHPSPFETTSTPAPSAR